MKGLLVLMVLCFALLEVNAKVVNREMIREEELRGVLKALRDLQMLTNMEKHSKESSEEDSGSHSGPDSDEILGTEGKPSQGPSDSKPEEDTGSGEYSGSGDSEDWLEEYKELIGELCEIESGELEDLEDELRPFHDDICEELEEECGLESWEYEELTEEEQEMYNDFCGDNSGFCDEFVARDVQEMVCRYESMFEKRVQEQKMKRAEKFAKIFERHIKYLKKTSA